MSRAGLLISLLTALVFSCEAEDKGSGTLRVEIWGEDFIEKGIPASEFADGWSVKFDHFLVNVGAISVAKEGAAPAWSDEEFRIYDLATLSGPMKITELTVPGGDYTHTTYTIAPAKEDTKGANAKQEDVARMKGLSVLVDGSASKGDKTIKFSWGFSKTTVYDPCHSIGKVTNNGTTTIQLTFHGDHLFYDDAVSENPSLRFEDIAKADSDGDNTVTATELKAYAIKPLEHYGVGSFDIKNMWEFLDHMVTTLGHIDGEGHCQTK